MIFLLLVSTLVTGNVPVHRMPAISDSCDIIVVMMEDGLLPDIPWEGCTSYQREEFWTYACTGMMMQRASWAGYVMICPTGIGEMIVETAESLAVSSGIPDVSMLQTGLGLEPVASCPSTVLCFFQNGSDPRPGSLPLRGSRWLEQDADTVMVTSPEEGNSFFWTGLADSVSLAPAGWRGIGTEVVPAGNGSVRLAHTTVHGSVPSNLSSISVDPHPVDTAWMKTLGLALAKIDSLVSDMFPLTDTTGHLLWIRGSGTGHPWRAAPSPSPPAAAEYRIPVPPVVPSTTPLFSVDPSSIPSALMIRLPGRLSDTGNRQVMETVLHRIIGRELMNRYDGDVFYEVRCSTDGEFTVWLVRDGGDTSNARSDSLVVLEALTSASLVPPGVALVQNAAIRASFASGIELSPPGVHLVSMELMNILFP